MNLVKKTKEKLDEYGIKMFTDYVVDDEKQHVIYADHMILFVGKEDKTISISFQATTRPDVAGNLTLIINEIGAKMVVMESFIYDSNEQFISGDKAFDIIKKTQEMKTYQEYRKQQIYQQLLESSECFEC